MGPIRVYDHLFASSKLFPNNAKLPLLIYNKVLTGEKEDPAEIAQLFATNGWTNSWKNGIYRYHHYHSNTHEVLGVYSGYAQVQFGGVGGIMVQIVTGDVVIIPAGVAHKCIANSDDFGCVGAYPDGKNFDIQTGKKGERVKTEPNIKAVPLPATDPVFGILGQLQQYWLA